MATSQACVGIVAPKQVHIRVDAGLVFYTHAHSECARLSHIQYIANFWAALVSGGAVVLIDLIFSGETGVATVVKRK